MSPPLPTDFARVSRLALGTVQMGLDYGVANASGRMSTNEAASVLRTARERGLDTLDTAIAYGESERTLGELGLGGWRVISKLPGVPDGCEDVAAWVHEQVGASLRRLRIARLHGLLLHRPSDLSAPFGDVLWAALREVQTAGVIEKIGVSIYAPDELAPLIPARAVQIVQAPLNLLDRRLVQSGWARRLADSGVEVHARSAFLQGLLLMSERPARFAPWTPLLSRWDAWREAQPDRGLAACLHYVLAQPEVSRVVVGVDTAAQLHAIADAVARSDGAWPQDLWSDDPVLLNPARWPR